MQPNTGQIAPWNDPTVRWVCEEHPTEDHEHIISEPFMGIFTLRRRCGGAGMPEPTEENFRKGYITK